MSYTQGMDEKLGTPVPTTAFALNLLRHSTPVQWTSNVTSAQERARIVEAVRALQEGGLSQRKALAEAAPGVRRPTFQGWMRRIGRRDGPLWERVLDGRIPPEVERVPAQVRSFVVGLRLAQPGMPYSKALELAALRYGQEGMMSERTLRRIWKEEGLPSPPRPEVEPEEVKTLLGGGLALLAAANVETGVMMEIASQVHMAGRIAAGDQDSTSVKPEVAGLRGERGRLTAAYNADARKEVEPGKVVDWRWGTDENKRKTRDLATLSILKAAPEALAAKLAAIGVCHLLTEQRGFVGLTGPLGSALELLCGVAYRPNTLSKCLAELAVCGAETEFYHAYGELAVRYIRKWTASETGRSWIQVVVYIDATHDPHWTDKFAESGPVSRTGRVQPCLSRLAVVGGAGHPLVMETYPGAMSLKKELPRLLERVEELVGESGIGQLVVMDAEMAVAELLASFKDRHFITVYKGPGKNFTPSGSWLPFRKRDQLREGQVLIRGKEYPDGLTFRAVEMQRVGSRCPHSTIFVTNCPQEEMGTLDVAPAYLSRWPHQEQGFRERRNGLGANHSVGFGGEYVEHIALDTRIDKAKRTLNNAQERLKIAEEALSMASTVEETRNKPEAPPTSSSGTDDIQDNNTGPEASRARCTSAADIPQHTPHCPTEAPRASNDDPAPELPADASRAEPSPRKPTAPSSLLKAARRERTAAQRVVEQATKHLNRLSTTPQLIYRRDTTRENIATAATLSVLLLIEFVLREYFGGLKSSLRTFIEQFIMVPVTIRTRTDRILYQFHANPRNPRSTSQLREACSVITARALRQSGRLMIFEVIDTTAARGGWPTSGG